MLDLKTIKSLSKKSFDYFVDSQFVAFFVSWVIILITVNNSDKIPQSVVKVIHHPITFSVAIFLSVFMKTKDFYISLATTVAVMLVFYIMNTHIENFQSTDVMPGCETIKISDLRKLFKDDEDFKASARECRVPSNIPMTDEYAPLIATYMVNSGKMVSESCSYLH